MPPSSKPPDWLRLLFDEAGPVALAVIHRIVARRDHAEDVLQETFVAAWRLRDRFDPRRGTEVAWILGIARSRALDSLRADGTRMRYEGEAMHAAAGGHGPGCDDFLAHSKLHSALTTLPGGQRACLELAYFSGLTQSEIARATGMALGSVKANVRRGLERLAGLFADELETGPAQVNLHAQMEGPAQVTPTSAGAHLTVVHTEQPAEPVKFGRPGDLNTAENATRRPRQSG